MDTTPMQTLQVAEGIAARNLKKISEDPIVQWERVAAQTISLVGEEGFDSLYTRSVFLAQLDFPWLGAIQRSSQSSPRFTELKRVLAKQPTKIASNANELLLKKFTSILVSLIGDELTRSILRSTGGHQASNSRPGAKDE